MKSRASEPFLAVRGRIRCGVALAVIAVAAWAAAPLQASEFEITADSFTVDKQVNLSSAAYFQGQAFAPGNPATATQLASPGGLYFDGTYYNVWNSQAGAWVQVATGTVETGRVARTGDTMTGQLTLSGSTLTVTGNAFSVGGSTFVVTSGGVGIGTGAPAAGYQLHVLNSGGDADMRIEGGPTGSAVINLRNSGGGSANVYAGTENGSGGNLIPGSSPYDFVVDQAAARGIDFGTSNVIRARIDSAGNVGIGTTSPGAKLDISADNAGGYGAAGFQLTGTNATNPHKYGEYIDSVGNWRFSDFTNGADRIVIQTNGNVGIGTTSPGAKLSFGGLVGSPAIYLYDNGAGVRYGYGIQGSELQTFIPTSAHLSFNAGGDLQASGTNEVMRITGGGNVGIGTTGPSTNLDIVKTGSGEQVPLRIENLGSNSSGTGTSIGFEVGLPGAAYDMARIEGLRGPSASGTAGGLEFYTGNPSLGYAAPAMYINESQYVGIGTTSPGYRLDVAGQINTNTGVSLNGALYANPDYVFEPGYRLMPLDRLRTFVASRKHLPHIPSTREVKKKGVEIFEQNRVQLENLEEAYLYLFQMEDRLKTQQAEIEELRAELERMRER